jgi:uncharacterized membrane protein
MNLRMTLAEKNLFSAGFVLGLGLLGAFDGIMFHQLLQWHHVVHHPDSQVELISDGVFHAVVSALMLWGAIRLFRHAREDQLSGRSAVFWGSIWVGGGVFNLVEGLINHHLLQLHHVKPGDPYELWYDLAYLASGLLLTFIGWRMCSPGGRSFSHAARS